MPLLSATSSQAIRLISEFGTLQLSYLAWACAKILSQEVPGNSWYDSEVSHALSDSVWSVSLRAEKFDPTFKYALGTVSCRISDASLLHQYGALGLANFAWSFAVLGIRDSPLLSAISASALPIISQPCTINTRAIAGIAWSFARLLVPDSPLLAAISSAAIRTIRADGCTASPVIALPRGHGSSWSMGDASALAWSLWRTG